MATFVRHLLLTVAGIAMACSGTDFAGNTNARDQGSETDGSDDPDSEVCTEAGITSAELLTPTVENGKPGNYVEYRVSLLTCDGKRKALTDNVILFDVEANDATGGKDGDFTYKIVETGDSGVLKVVFGEDLFGNKGERFFHSRTDQPIDVETDQDSFRIRIRLGGHAFRRSGSETFDDPLVVPSYLRFGDAKPVKKDLTFVGGAALEKTFKKDDE